ncbi:HET domain-containing protein [Colletotrichum graminicola M1.001]|uniref:HET domain-containing protein n=1 Tax=Colletotrichum graminicola (strain M1.001 / M2 / FGSC 10212) TaxID=645133 RepID=E3Q3N6_COLGM|nr:HET domain-containing protein [Colletotrichum graminicola M1.001]EFQ25638.1 HET domain-containing protein [Colletotrichum graminicola M1.001]
MDSTKRKKGYTKILQSCERASQDGYDWIWIDTCCIDKTSSTELSEAINSMFQWYREPNVCYVYLSDATGTQPFYKATKGSIAHAFHGGTHEAGHYRKLSRLHERLKWLARRETTRIEDMAYCMLGIFDINMPLLYGEGKKAFIRLQEEIINATTDQSIFAWAEPYPSNDYPYLDHEEYNRVFSISEYGIIAVSPRMFEGSASVAMFARPRPSRPHAVVTRQGIRVHLLMCENEVHSSMRDADDSNIFMAVLDCQNGQLIELESPDISYQSWKLKEVYITQSNLHPLPPGFWVLPLEDEMSIESVYPPEIWDIATNILQPQVSWGKIGAIGLQVRDVTIALILGFSNHLPGVVPWCKLCSYSGEDELSDVFAAYEEVPSREGAAVGVDFSELAGLLVSIRTPSVSSVPMNIVQLELVELSGPSSILAWTIMIASANEASTNALNGAASGV